MPPRLCPKTAAQYLSTQGARFFRQRCKHVPRSSSVSVILISEDQGATGIKPVHGTLPSVATSVTADVKRPRGLFERGPCRELSSRTWGAHLQGTARCLDCLRLRAHFARQLSTTLEGRRPPEFNHCDNRPSAPQPDKSQAFLYFTFMY
jgi:hypothetical protein